MTRAFLSNIKVFTSCSTKTKWRWMRNYTGKICTIYIPSQTSSKNYSQESNIYRTKTTISSLHSTPLDLTNTSGVRHIGARRSRTSNALPLEVAKEGGVRSTQRSRATKSVDLAHVSQSSTANRIRPRARAAEELPRVTQQRRVHILEHVPLRHDVRPVVESMPRVSIEVVVHSVQQGVAADLGGAPRGVVDVVALEGNQVVGARQVQRPVVVVVAGGGPVGVAIEIVVGDGDAVGGVVAEDEHLAADEGELVVV